MNTPQCAFIRPLVDSTWGISSLSYYKHSLTFMYKCLYGHVFVSQNREAGSSRSVLLLTDDAPQSDCTISCATSSRSACRLLHLLVHTQAFPFQPLQ